jgi:hypothetical protein
MLCVPAVLTKKHLPRSHLHKTIKASVTEADAMLNNTREERSRRILVPLLVGAGMAPCCMLKNFDAKVRSANPNIDIVVFTHENSAAQDEDACVMKDVYYMALHEHWGPTRRGSATVPHLWSFASRSDASYRNMGHWRLTFQFAFVELLGYKYLWQVDDDIEFTAQESLNVTEYMQGKLGAGVEMFNDGSEVTWSLPEFTRAFLVAERLVPRGSLYQKHTKPPGLDGLYTVTPTTANTFNFSGFHADEGGWDRFVIGERLLDANVCTQLCNRASLFHWCNMQCRLSGQLSDD